MAKISTGDIIFESHDDAKTALDRMAEIAKTYGRVTLMDLKDLAGLVSMYTDTKCYWTTEMLKHAAVYRVRDGWIINLIAPIKENENENANEASTARQPEYRKSKTESKLVFITINTEEVENVDDVLDSTFKFIATFPDREIHLTIT